ncbi:gliding motility-associated C-terminal domain-containing protein [Tenacibaculum adriaticum]|nr:gliding motility-associated C-terminal domain-containing protein [Tenacibaculum adriaticum]
MISLFTDNVNAQCAGTDSSITICNKESDPSLQNFNLFNQLGGVPQTGGTWTTNNPLNENALNNSTGTVNLWVINRFGTHTFTYTNNDCNESAIVTLNLGGYPGEDNVDGGANACSDDSAVNLFSFLDNNNTALNVDINGVWSGASSSSSAAIHNDYFFDADSVGPGTYSLIYTVDDVNTCTSRVSNVILEVHQGVESGEPLNINLCESDDMSVYTNLDLHDRLVGEDPNGIWTDNNGTGQLTDVFDTIINIEEIYNDFGAGTYSFTYTVTPLHPVCLEQKTTITIFIEKQYVLSGVQNIIGNCVNKPLNVSVDYDVLFLPNDFSTSPDEVHSDSYLINYQVYDSNNSLIDNIFLSDFTISDGNFVLPIPGKSTSGLYSVSIISLVNLELTKFCDIQIDVPSSTFIVQDPMVSIDDICIDEDAIINIENILDSTGNPLNDTFQITYSLNDPQLNTINITTDPLDFINGKGTFTIDSSLLQITENNGYTINILQPSELMTDCITGSFNVNPIPEEIQLNLIVDNQCNATNMEVNVVAPPLSTGEYTVTYEVTEVGNPELLIDNTIVFIGGQANYQVDITNLEEGYYEVILKSTQNDTTPCRTQFEFELTESFSIGGIPDPPTLNTSQTFCFSDYGSNGPTISNIVVDSGENLTWYEDDTSTTPLDPTTLLLDSEDYYVTSTNPNNNCHSSERAVVVVSVITTLMVTSPDINPIFCASDNATIANLNATTNGGALVWYDSATDGNILESNTQLVNGTSYFAVESISICESTSRLQFNVTIIDPPIPVLTGSLLLCALDNLTILDLEEIISTEDPFELIWYDAAENGLEIDKSNLLQEGINYYVASIDPQTRCESDRVEISVILSECDPENYDFFIPDGFSPNNDGVNDNYFIPYIEFFYPKYELEIFNRYGQSLFKGDINHPAWDGKNNGSGNDTTSGVYFYILKYNKNNLKPKQGRLYLSK